MEGNIVRVKIRLLYSGILSNQLRANIQCRIIEIRDCRVVWEAKFYVVLGVFVYVLKAFLRNLPAVNTFRASNV